MALASMKETDRTAFTRHPYVVIFTISPRAAIRCLDGGATFSPARLFFLDPIAFIYDIQT